MTRTTEYSTVLSRVSELSPTVPPDVLRHQPPEKNNLVRNDHLHSHIPLRVHPRAQWCTCVRLPVCTCVLLCMHICERARRFPSTLFLTEYDNNENKNEWNIFCTKRTSPPKKNSNKRHKNKKKKNQQQRRLPRSQQRRLLRSL